MITMKFRAEMKELLSLAGPCIMENIASSMVGLIDTAMVGSVGAVATAAVGICTTPTWMVNGIVRALGIGGTALVTRSIGANMRSDAEHTATQVFRVNLLLIVFLAVLFYILAPIMPIWLQASEEVIPESCAYARILSFSFPFYYTGMCMGNLLRGAGDTRTPMLSGLLANAVNIVGNFLLIYPTRMMDIFTLHLTVWGAGMGVRGAAIASMLGMSASGIYVFLKMTKKGSSLYLIPEWKTPFDLLLLKRVFRIALPSAFQYICTNLGQMIFSSYYAALGTVELASYHITSQIEAVGYMPAHGFQSAAVTVVGTHLGAGEPEISERQGKKAVVSSLVLLSAIGILIYLFRFPLASLFTSDAEVTTVTAKLLILCALVQPFNAISMVTSSVLNGAGDTKTPFIYSALTMWLVRITFSNILGFQLGFGVMGIYFSMILDLAVRGTLLLIRFHSGKWKKIKV